jgi:hypothetical protein
MPEPRRITVFVPLPVDFAEHAGDLVLMEMLAERLVGQTVTLRAVRWLVEPEHECPLPRLRPGSGIVESAKMLDDGRVQLVIREV